MCITKQCFIFKNPPFSLSGQYMTNSSSRIYDKEHLYGFVAVSFWFYAKVSKINKQEPEVLTEF